jgi:hypothetical protein
LFTFPEGVTSTTVLLDFEVSVNLYSVVVFQSKVDLTVIFSILSGTLVPVDEGAELSFRQEFKKRIATNKKSKSLYDFICIRFNK